MKTIIQINCAPKPAVFARLEALISTFTAVLKITGCLLLLATINGCIEYAYAPNAHNVPLFKEKDDANLSAGFKIGLSSLGCDVQGAYAITNHLGLMANYSYFKGRSETGGYGDNYSNTYNSNLVEFGLGYYLPFKNKMVFETYGGIGGSKITDKYESNYGPSGTSLGSVFCFIQPAIGIYHKNIEFGISTRLKGVDFNKGQFDIWMGQGPGIYYSDAQVNHVALFLEPAFTFRGGGKHVKLQVQAGYSVYCGNSNITVYDPLNVNIGLIYNIHGKKMPEAVQ